ncbi:alpha/beta hydrolase fold domain-containing protein [Bifidobacterium oedipodis]|uniref:Carboxylesterase type B n=1 Tax=Bifidobacterium oedipodis TaxID=2675322 RepID=A0A7Y0HSF4_9BIFI|nr:alpha/beta hydrolase fold domain-containing protein [Bifidobacterium sp. DSM 109957]NMM95100.1 carboxylesterase type B [Bifidobacterium sp. DSM 109957]
MRSYRLRGLLILWITVSLLLSTAFPVSALGVESAVPVATYSDVPYVNKANAHKSQKLDLYLPSEDSYAHNDEKESETDLRPLVVRIHGGAWYGGDKELGDDAPVFAALLEQGYAVASINYRLSVEARWPAQIYDCKAAIRFLRAHAQQYGIDPTRITVFGESAGGHLAMMLGVTNGQQDWEDLDMGNAQISSAVQAVISVSGIADLNQWGTRTGDSLGAQAAKDLLLGAGHDDQDEVNASPITYVNEQTVPMLLVHGGSDDVVSYQQSELMAEAMNTALADNRAETWLLAKAGHMDVPMFYASDQAHRRYSAFLAKSLGLSEPLISVRRLYNPYNGLHLLTLDKDEDASLRANGWIDESSAFQALDADAVNGSPVYRLYNSFSGEHILTSNVNEYESLSRQGWFSEGVAFVAPSDGDTSVFRLFNPYSGYHMYTSDVKEYERLGKNSWQREGVAFMVSGLRSTTED